MENFNFLNSLTILVLGYIINSLVLFAVIFIERRSPSATLAWILVLTFLPYVGIIFYLVFNQNLARSKINKLTDTEEYYVNQTLRRQGEEIDTDTFQFNSAATRRWRHLIKLNNIYGNAYYSQNNNIELLNNGRDMFEMVLDDIKNAKEFINIEYFIIKNDHIGQMLIETLTEKAKEGVQVRLLIDALGCRSLTEKVLRGFTQAGGHVGYFFRPKFKVIGFKFNYRNHRKIVVTDGVTGYTGGYNIAKEYLGEKRKFGPWRDTHIRITGEGVADLNARFILDWRFITKEDLEAMPSALETTDSGNDMGVQIVSSGPESPKEEVKRAFMKMITNAEKNVYVQTPYFVPDSSIFESLKMAAQSGVDVKVMVPCKPDHIFVYWATFYYVGMLLRSGGRAYIYDDGFLHAKTMVVDGEVSTVGSANFDNRSFRLNFETNAFIFHEGFAKEMENSFNEDIAHSHELTLEAYNQRGLGIRFKEAISRLIADIL